MHCRMATHEDLPALARMRWAFRAEAGEVPRETEAAFVARYCAFVEAGLTSGQWTYWIATEGGDIVAHMAVCVVPSIPRPARPSDQWGYLTDCYTRPERRRRGIGSALLARVRAWATAHDVELLLVWPSERSGAFYRRAGFAPAADVLQLALRDYDAPPPAVEHPPAP